MNDSTRTRSSITGRFVKAADAFLHPESTVTERDRTIHIPETAVECPACHGKGYITRSEAFLDSGRED